MTPADAMTFPGTPPIPAGDDRAAGLPAPSGREIQPVDLSRLATPGGYGRRAFHSRFPAACPGAAHTVWQEIGLLADSTPVTRHPSAAQPYGSGRRTPRGANAPDGWQRRDACEPPAALDPHRRHV